MLTHALPEVSSCVAANENRIRTTLRQTCVHAFQALCGIRGHDFVRRAGKCRLFLECLACGHETVGWRIDIAPSAGPTRRDC
jgi:hypothetical protein